MKTRILLTDDHEIMRKGLRSLLERESDFEVIGEASNGRDAIRLARELEPDIMVMDVGMPDVNGMEATSRIMAKMPDMRIVALSMHSDKRFVTGMLTAGAYGYVLKSEAVEELVGAIRAVQTGRVYTSPRVTDVVMQDYVNKLTTPQGDGESPLTPRESEVLGLLAGGASTRQISEQLHLSVNTVDTHKRRIQQKLDLHSVAELTKYAIRHGLTQLDE
ncbi:MAG: response regulator transcription factor [Xanthomonadales bacterium]|nr:response regulator transcription factor [Xanthomonadales bacterium]